ncbi:hypothetical protein JZU71_01170, partial [bacterium]|nr:hypothetical protein [bacterium]
IWTEGTPDLLRWPAYEKVVINQDFGKKESFVVNYEIDSASGWIPSADIVTREWTAEDKTNTYIQGICGAFDEPSGLYQTIPI